MFTTPEYDDLFNVSASTGSNLASLFGTSLTMQQNDNQSLMYNAPKNPKLNIEETPKVKSTLPSSLMFTAFVDVYMLTSDENYAAQGKCGLAVIGNQSVKTYDVILYRTKQDIIMRRNLKSDFTLVIKEDNFTTFTDDQKQKWVIQFKNFKEVTDFSDEVRKHGANIIHGLGKVNIAETKPNIENATTKDSDAASDSSSTQTKASILSRMAKMGQSILPTSSQTNLDAKPNITDSETDEFETIKKPIIKKRHKVVTNLNDTVVKSCNQPSTVPEYVVVNGQLLPISSVQAAVSAIPNSYHNQLPYPSQLTINPPQLTSVADPLNIFIAESRTHNCELRMNMSHLSSKLDTILAKLELPNTNIVNQNVNELQRTIIERDIEIAERGQLYEALQVQYDTLCRNTNTDQEVISACQQQIEQLKQTLADQDLKSNELSASLHEKTLITEQQLQTISTLNATLHDLKSESSVSNDVNNSETERLNNCLTNLQSEVADRNAKIEIFEKTLKSSMNSMFQDIMQNFKDDSTYTGNYIKAIVSKNLKASTLIIIQDFNRDFKDASIHNGVDIVHNGEVPPPIPEF